MVTGMKGATGKNLLDYIIIFDASKKLRVFHKKEKSLESSINFYWGNNTH